MFTVSLPHLQSETEYRRERLAASWSHPAGRRTAAPRPRRRRGLHLPGRGGVALPAR